MKALFLAVLVAAPLGASARSKIAVLDVRAVQGVQPGTAAVLTAIVVDDTARAGFDVISQADVTAMLGFEKQKKMLGCSEDSSCLAEIGGALGADYVLSGQVGQIGSRYHLSFQLLEARRARVLARAARFSDRDEDALASATQGVVAELLAAAAASPKGAATAAKTEGAAKATEPAKTAQAPKADAQAAKTPAAKADLKAQPPAPAPVTQVQKAAWRPSKALAWGTVGAGAALLALGVGFGMKADAARSDLEDAWQDPNYAAIYDQKSDEVSSAAARANLCYLLGTVTTGAGAWFVWKNRTAPLAVAPVAAGGQVGLVAAGSF